MHLYLDHNRLEGELPTDALLSAKHLLEFHASNNKITGSVSAEFGAMPRQGCTHSRGVSDWLHGPPELDLWVALTPGGCQIGCMCDQNSTYGLHSLPGGVRLVT
jgi:hypothetical protein